MEEAAASLRSNNFRIFRDIILPNPTPAIIAGCALAFARAIEFGSLVLIAGNIPSTQVASVYIFGRIESDNTTAAAAVSVFLLLFVAVAVLFALNLFKPLEEPNVGEPGRFARYGMQYLALGYLALLLAIPLVMIFVKTANGISEPLDSITSPVGLHAFWLTILCVAVAVPLNTIFGVLCALMLCARTSAARRSSSN